MNSLGAIEFAALAAAGLLVAMGAVGLAWGRRDASDAATLRLPGVGAVSEITKKVAGLACLASAYHVVVYTLDIEGFRAPWPLVVAGAAGSVLLSLGIDALENHRG